MRRNLLLLCMLALLAGCGSPVEPAPCETGTFVIGDSVKVRGTIRWCP